MTYDPDNHAVRIPPLSHSFQERNLYSSLCVYTFHVVVCVFVLHTAVLQVHTIHFLVDIALGYVVGIL